MAVNGNQGDSAGSASTSDQKGPQNVSNTSKSMLPFVILGCLVLGLAMIGALFFLQKLGKVRPAPSAAPMVFLNIEGSGLVQETDSNAASIKVKDAATAKVYTLKVNAQTKIFQKSGKAANFGSIKAGQIITFKGKKESKDSDVVSTFVITIPQIKDFLPGTG